jgi:DNA-binding response OmpR family regulator
MERPIAAVSPPQPESAKNDGIWTGISGVSSSPSAGARKAAGLKVLFITGYAENAAISNGHLGPGMHVLSKPFAMEWLAARIKAIISRE